MKTPQQGGQKGFPAEERNVQKIPVQERPHKGLGGKSAHREIARGKGALGTDVKKKWRRLTGSLTRRNLFERGGKGMWNNRGTHKNGNWIRAVYSQLTKTGRRTPRKVQNRIMKNTPQPGGETARTKKKGRGREGENTGAFPRPRRMKNLKKGGKRVPYHLGGGKNKHGGTLMRLHCDGKSQRDKINTQKKICMVTTETGGGVSKKPNPLVSPCYWFVGGGSIIF